MRYLKIGPIIFEINLYNDSENRENDETIINAEHALYETNKFIILNYRHIADNDITDKELNMCLIYLYLYINKIKEINDDIVNFFKNHYNVYKMDDFINKEIDRNIHYFKSYERAFNFRFILDKQYELFPLGYSGLYRNWTQKGELVIEFYHVNGKIEGSLKKGEKIFNYFNNEPIDGGIKSDDLILLDHYLFDYE